MDESECAVVEWVWRPRLLVAGGTTVGKTALVKVFCGEEFPASYQMTTIPLLNHKKITLKGKRDEMRVP